MLFQQEDDGYYINIQQQNGAARPKTVSFTLIFILYSQPYGENKWYEQLTILKRIYLPILC